MTHLPLVAFYRFAEGGCMISHQEKATLQVGTTLSMANHGKRYEVISVNPAIEYTLRDEHGEEYVILKASLDRLARGIKAPTA